MIVEFTGVNRVDDLLSGRLREADSSRVGAALWRAQQLCDLVETRSARDTVSYRLHLNAVAGAGRPESNGHH
jgi:hypothetical protein